MNLLLRALRQRQQRRPYGSMRQNAPRNKSMLQRNSALHVRATVIDSLGNRQKLVMQFTRALVVLGLACKDHLVQGLRSDVAVADKHAIDVKDGMEEILVMAGQDGYVGTLLAEDRDLCVPAAHVADTVLHGDDARLSGDVEQGLEVVGALGVVGVLEKNQGQLGDLVHPLVAVLRSARLVAETEPAVRRIEETSLSSGLLGPLSLEGGNFSALTSDTSNDRNLVVNRLDKGLDHINLLLGCEESTLTSVAENDKALDAPLLAEPRTETLDSLVVNGAILCERSDRCGDETLEIDSHFGGVRSGGLRGC